MKPHLRLNTWLLLVGFVVFLAVLSAGQVIVKQESLHWPIWVVPSIAAILGTLAAVVKPLLNALLEAPAARLRRVGENNQQRDHLLSEITAGQHALPRVSEITDTARTMLGIHRSIPLASGDHPQLSADLPTYVERDLDRELHSWLSAKQQASGFALIVGPAVSGKTRTAYESIKSALPDWQLLVPQSASELCDLLGTGMRQRTVVWLNELQHFLGADGFSVAFLRRLLTDPSQSVIIISTIWVSWYERLVSSKSNANIDTRTDAYEIITLLADRFDLVPSFSEAEWRRLCDEAVADPRLREVFENKKSGNPTELLAAAPELIRRWRNAGNPHGAAVLSGAIAMCHCGLPDPLDIHLLGVISSMFLTASQRAVVKTDWLDDALDWACEPVRGDIAPLARVSTAPGVIDGVIISDVLVHYAEAYYARPENEIPDAVWDACIDNVTGRQLAMVGIKAVHSGKLEHAEIALSRSAGENASSNVLNHLGIVANKRGEHQRAEELWAKASAAGSCCASISLAKIFAERGDSAQAEEILLAGDLRDHDGAATLLAKLAERRGDSQVARSWWSKATEAGDTSAMRELGQRAMADGNSEEAESWWTRGADKGSACCLEELGSLAMQRGKLDDAESFFARAVELGCTHAPVSLGELLVDRGDEGAIEARRLWLNSAANGSSTAMCNLGLLAKRQGDSSAEEWFQKAADEGLGCAMDNLGQLADEHGDFEVALGWWERSATAGCHHGLVSLGRARYRYGDVVGAREVWTRAAEGGDKEAAIRLQDLDNGDVPGNVSDL